MKPQKPGNSPRPEPEVVKRDRIAKEQTKQRVRSWTVFDAKTFSSSFEVFVLSIMQDDVHTLLERSCSVCESSVRLGHHDR